MSAKCKRCGRKLTDPYSVAVGIGPDCRGKLIKAGFSMPKARYRVVNGRAEFIGVEGKIKDLIVVAEEEADETHCGE